MLWKSHPEKAVSFTANNDTEKDSNEDNYIASENKLKAMTFILTHPEYAIIFYLVFENLDFQGEIKNLIAIHNIIARVEIEILMLMMISKL